MENGYSQLQARIIASRLRSLPTTPLGQHISPSLQQLDPPSLLPDIELAAGRIAGAIIRGEHLVLVSDHDADGATGHAVARATLLDVMGVPAERVHSYLSHRLLEGYGVSDALCDRMLAEMQDIPRPAVVITIDQGSADQRRIARLKEEGFETVVTDHHAIPEEGVPADAFACVNPVRKDSRFPDKQVAGCHVIWLVMCATRKALINSGHLPPDAGKMAPYLDWVATGTAADCVGLAMSRNNRAVMRYGLWLMNTRPRPCWSALLEVARWKDKPMGAVDVAFTIASRINASGRVDDARLSLDLLLEQDHSQALGLAAQLEAANTERKSIQRELTKVGMEIAAEQDRDKVTGIVVFFENGHPGIHGVTASRLCEAFGRPVACFSPKRGSAELISGSFRSIRGVHIRDALVRANALAPGAIEHFGGHEGAAGATIKGFELERFTQAFRAAVAEQRDGGDMAPFVLTDGPLLAPWPPEQLAELDELEPFGREFESPVFDGYFSIRNPKPMGDGTHFRFEGINKHGHAFEFVWFSARTSPDDPPPLRARAQARIAFTVSANTYRGTTRTQHIVSYLEINQESDS